MLNYLFLILLFFAVWTLFSNLWDALNIYFKKQNTSTEIPITTVFKDPINENKKDECIIESPTLTKEDITVTEETVVQNHEEPIITEESVVPDSDKPVVSPKVKQARKKNK